MSEINAYKAIRRMSRERCNELFPKILMLLIERKEDFDPDDPDMIRDISKQAGFVSAIASSLDNFYHESGLLSADDEDDDYDRMAESVIETLKWEGVL